MVLGVTHESHNEELVNYGIRSAVFEKKQALALSEDAIRLGKTAYIHLAVDTGMSRIGMYPCRDSADLVARISKMPGICVEGMFTHFAKADEADKSSAYRQLAQYLDFIKMVEERGVCIPIKHISNSAGIVDMKEANCDMVRAGISI